MEPIPTKKELQKEYSRKSYLKHREKILESFPCECGGRFRYANRMTHGRSFRHKCYIRARDKNY